MNEKLAVNHELYNERDPSGYSRFLAALNFDIKNYYKKEATKRMFSFKSSSVGSSLDKWEREDLMDKVVESFLNNSFIENFLMNKEQYLSKKAIHKFFKQN